MNADDGTIRDDREQRCYEMATDGGTAYAAYRREDGAIIFTHTVVPDAARGHGVGTRLIAAALADARKQGLTVVAECPFVAAYLQRHPDAAG